MRRIPYITLIALLFLSTIATRAQSGQNITVRDFQTWNSAGLVFKANKKLKFGISEQIRFKDNSSAIDQYFTQGFGEYKLSKALGLGAALRYIRLNDTEGKIQGYENHLRYAMYSKFKHKINRLQLKYRLQYQSKKEFGETQKASDVSIQKIRFKAGGTYNIRKWKWDPKLSAEIFRNLGTNGEFSKIRGTLGTGYETKKAGSFDFFYRIEKELNETYPQTTHVFGVNYQYTLKRKKK